MVGKGWNFQEGVDGRQERNEEDGKELRSCVVEIVPFGWRCVVPRMRFAMMNTTAAAMTWVKAYWMNALNHPQKIHSSLGTY